MGSSARRSQLQNKADRPTGEGAQAATPQPAQALPAYDAEKFQKNLPAWLQAVKDGKAKAEQIVGKLKSTNTITKEQEAAILMPKAPDQAPQDTQPATAQQTQQGDTQ